MFDAISEKFSSAIRSLRGLNKLSESNISAALMEVKSALLSSDVNFSVATNFIDRVKDRCIGQDVLKNITPDQQIIKIIYDELVALLGDSNQSLSDKRPLKCLLVGLHGSGKTTSAVKLINLLKNKYKFTNPLTIACDVYRPAAIDQLQTLSLEAGIECYAELNENNPVTIANKGYQYAKNNGHDLVIFDTAGRLQIDSNLIDEVKNIASSINPDEIILVADGALGQEAANVAKAFHDALGLTGIILTKLDGDTHGGAALSMKEVTGVPIKFIGTGEKINALEIFYPERIAQRILGMGDVVSLVEKAQEQIDEKKAKELEKKLKKGKFDLNDLLDQMKSIHKMGPIESIIKHLPGVGNLNIGNEANDKLKQTEAIILSMTIKERTNPGIIDGSRKNRIANGSGTTVQDVNSLLKMFKQMQQLMKKVKGNKFNIGSLLGL